MEIPKGLGTVDDLLKRFKHASERYELFRSLHQDAFDYAAPNRETFTLHAAGQKKNRQVFDDTAVDGLVIYANRVKGAMFPPWLEWLEFVAGTDVEEDDSNKEILEKAQTEFFAALNHSNFYTEIDPALIDYGIGTGAIQLEQGELGEPIKFTNVPLAELYPEAPAGGPIKSAWRKQKIEPKLINQVWPDAELSEKLAKLADKPAAKEVTILNGQLYNPADGMYHQVIVYEAEKALLFAQSFESKRLIVFRNDVTPGEVFGRGPIIRKLPSIMTANKEKEFILRNAAIQTAGMYTGVDDGIFNPHTVNVAPGAVIPVGSNNSQNPSLVPVTPSGNIGISVELLKMEQDSIRKALFSDPLGDVTDPVRSATENMIRQQEMLKNSGASFGRLNTELIKELVAGVMDILADDGRVERLKVNGKEIDFKLKSPLANAENLEDFQNIQAWYGFLQASLPEEALIGSVKIEEMPKITASKLGVTSDLVRTEEERQQIGQQLQAATEQSLEGGTVGASGQ